MTELHDQPHHETRLHALARGRQDRELMDHLATCGRCREELAAVRELVRYEATTGGTMADVPTSLVDRMATLLPHVRPDLVSQARSGAEGLRHRLRRVTAERLFDSGATPQLAGLRGADRRTRQLAFVSEVADLDLEVIHREGAYTVAGQLGMDTVPPNLRIRFVPAEADPLAEAVAGAVQSAISALGYFELTLTAGEWVAAVEVEDAVVLFPGVRL
jgi:hypothetical protein